MEYLRIKKEERLKQIPGDTGILIIMVSRLEYPVTQLQCRGLTNLFWEPQIMALHNAVNASSLAKRYNISEKVNTEMAEGFTKYTTGSYTDYKTARDAREDIKNKGVVAPFVTAYNGGKRITVQEALMSSKEPWIQ